MGNRRDEIEVVVGFDISGVLCMIAAAALPFALFAAARGVM
jgi:hypothetical protein